MGERDAGIGGAAGSGGDAGHHLEGHAFGHQGFDFLAAAAEDEGVAPLETQHPLALLRQAHQQGIDVLLLEGVLVAFLAGVDELGIATHQIQHFGRDQAIVDHHVGLLHQAQGAEGEQIRIAGARAHQIDLAGLRRRLDLLHRFFEQRPGFPVLAGHQPVGHRPLEDPLPELANGIAVGQPGLHLLPVGLHQLRQAAVGGGDEGLEPCAQQARQHRRGATGGDGDLHRIPVDDGRNDEAAQLGGIHHVDRDAAGLRRLRNLAIDRLVVGGGDDHHLPVHVGRAETLGQMADFALLGPLLQFRAELGGHHGHLGAGPLQHEDLARGHLAAAHHQTGLALHVHEKGKELHAGSAGC